MRFVASTPKRAYPPVEVLIKPLSWVQSPHLDPIQYFINAADAALAGETNSLLPKLARLCRHWCRICISVGECYVGQCPHPLAVRVIGLWPWEAHSSWYAFKARQLHVVRVIRYHWHLLMLLN